jgi:hypothetical protein
MDLSVIKVIGPATTRPGNRTRLGVKLNLSLISICVSDLKGQSGLFLRSPAFERFEKHLQTVLAFDPTFALKALSVRRPFTGQGFTIFDTLELAHFTFPALAFSSRRCGA